MVDSVYIHCQHFHLYQRKVIAILLNLTLGGLCHPHGLGDIGVIGMALPVSNSTNSFRSSSDLHIWSNGSVGKVLAHNQRA